MRYLELNSNGVVVNVVIWDGVTPYTPEGVAQLLREDEHPGVGYGWRRVDDAWIAPETNDESPS